MAASFDVTLLSKSATGIGPEAVDGDHFAGSLAAIGHPLAHGTAATRGRATPYLANAPGLAPAGLNFRYTEGDVSLPTIPRSDIGIEGHVYKLPVAGLAGSRLDVLRKVYAVDNDTYTLTKPAAVAKPVGLIYREFSASEAYVYLFGMMEQVLMSMAGADTRTELLSVESGVVSTSGRAGSTGIIMPYHARLESVFGIVVNPATGTGADIEISMSIGATPVDGGSIEWVEADLVGARKVGSAIVGDNRVHRGDLLNVELDAATAGTGGLMAIYGVFDLDVTQ